MSFTPLMMKLAAALRKTTDVPFVVPLRGMYSGGNVERSERRARYGV
jgi:hypothetical protein